MGMINSALSLGSAIGPTFGGAITDALDFSWMLSALAALTLLMVSLINYNFFALTIMF